MIVVASIVIYVCTILLWFVVWYGATGYRLMKDNKLLIMPWLLCPLFLIGNLLMTILFGEVEILLSEHLACRLVFLKKIAF